MTSAAGENFVINSSSKLIQAAGRIRARLGPGLLFAAAAVGTSHLVQSTRAGAGYGLSLTALILLVCLLKYPLFRFAADYAAATGETLVAGYRRRGVTLVLLMLFVTATEAVAAVAGVTLVTAGIARWLLALDVPDLTTALVLLALTTALVGFGRYRLLEASTGLLVALFSVLTLIATVAALPVLSASAGSVFPPVALNTSNLSFATAVSGWMPIGNTAAMMLTGWILVKQQQQPRSLGDVRFDFNLGYSASAALAVCFLIMGAAVLYGQGLSAPTAGAQFATTFVDMFAAVVGEWARYPVAIAAFCVMYSTLLAILDGFPRILENFVEVLVSRGESTRRPPFGFYTLLLLITGAAAVFLSFFLGSFTSFIDLVTITGFIAAPVVAWANHLVIRGDNVPPAARPGPLLLRWNMLAIGALLIASGGFLYLRFLG